MQTMKIIATGLPASVEDYQLALNAAFAGGKAYGTAKVQNDLAKICDKLSVEYGKAGLPMVYHVLSGLATQIQTGGKNV
jgi:hypothetical protein